MKKIILILLCAYSIQLTAQSFSISVDNDTTYCSEYGETNHCYSYVVNETSETLEIDILREIIYTQPDWLTAMCFDTVCYYSMVDSVRVTVTAENSAQFRSGFILFNDTTSNEAIVKYLFRNVNQTDDQIELFTYAVNESTMTSISNIDQELQLDVFPNPVEEELFIKTELAIESVFVFDSQGRLINVSGSEKHFALGQLSKGIYFLKIKTNEGLVVRKIVKD